MWRRICVQVDDSDRLGGLLAPIDGAAAPLGEGHPRDVAARRSEPGAPIRGWSDKPTSRAGGDVGDGGGAVAGGGEGEVTPRPTALGPPDAATAATYEGVLSGAECDALLEFCESNKGEFVLQTRNSLVNKFHSTEPRLASVLLRRLWRCAPHLGCKEVLDNVRLYWYPPGGQIKPHTDGVLASRATGELTTHSIIVYLNDNTSGATEFLTDVGPGHGVLASVAPSRGVALVFRHACPHHGALVEDGRKVILRLDMVADCAGPGEAAQEHRA